MTETANSLLQWLNLNPNWAGFFTFIISAAESVAVIGTIVPGSIMMTAIGTLAGSGIIPLWPTLIWAILGAIAGDGVSYWIGYRFKNHLHAIWPFSRHPEMLASGERFFKKHGGKSIFIGRFVGPVRALVPVIAGMFKVKPLVFTIANVLSAIGWAPAYMLPGILLGAASLELPPDVTTHAVVMVLLFIMFFCLCIWFIKISLRSIHEQINTFLNWIWNSLKKSRYFRIITLFLEYHDDTRTHGQLVLAFYFMITLVLFALLANYIEYHPPSTIAANSFLFYLFRSIQTPELNSIMLKITQLGEANVVLPAAGLMFAWLAYSKRWHTAWHVLALILLVGASTEACKIFIHSPRPWGIMQSPNDGSFPSGHSVLSLAFYLGLSLLLVEKWRLNKWWCRLLFTLCGSLIFVVSGSRLYFGLHWFTDIIGGWLLGMIVLMLVVLSYNRHLERKQTKGSQILIVALVSLALCYTPFYYRHVDSMQKDYQQAEWPVYTISLDDWLNRTGDHIPLYRINRFGLELEIFNLQWIGSLQHIEDTLLHNGWSLPPEPNWVSILQRITDVKSAEHLPLVSPLFLDKKPVLVMVKQSEDKKLLVLRLWDSHLKIANTSSPLWLGAVDVVPRTFSWLFKNTRARKISLTPDLIFTHKPTDLTIKHMVVKTKQDKDRTLLLIKPHTMH